MKRFSWTVILMLCVVVLPFSVAREDAAHAAEQWKVFETSFESSMRVVFKDDFSKDKGARWRDDGSKSSITNGQLVTQKGALVVLEEKIKQYLSVSVDARSNAEAGIILNYTDKNNYLLGLYSPSMKRMYFHKVIDGKYGEPLGAGDGPLTGGPRTLPKLNENITLTVTLQNGVATLDLKSGKQTYSTSIETKAQKSGKLGLWHYQVGNHQIYDNFKVVNVPKRKAGVRYLLDSTLTIERVPSPQNWVLVLEKVTTKTITTKKKGTP